MLRAAQLWREITAIAVENLLGLRRRKKNRSKLSNTKLQGVLQVLSLLVAEVSSEIDLEKLKDGFGCRSCIDKLKHYAGKHHELKSNLCSAIPVLPKVPQPQQPTAQIDSPQPPTATNTHGIRPRL